MNYIILVTLSTYQGLFISTLPTNATLTNTASLVTAIVKTLEENKAIDVQSYDISGKSDFADAMVIASGTSNRHLSALAGHVKDLLKNQGFEHIPIEGEEAGEWVLVDAGAVIVHLFKPEARERYRLEKMWSV